MSMGIGGSNSNAGRIVLRNRDGSYAGSISISKPKTKKKRKRLDYNFSQISAQIMQAKTSGSARKVMSRAHMMLVSLLRKSAANMGDDSEYDSSLLRHALLHARKMVRIAKKRMQHLEQEEAIEKNLSPYLPDPEEEAAQEEIGQEEDVQALLEMSEEELRQLMEELQKAMQEAEEELSDSEIDSLLTDTALEHMDANDLDTLKKKHRSEEFRAITEANLSYLKALFDHLEQEKQATADAIANQANTTGDSAPSFSSAPISGVSLELGGAQIPVSGAALPAMVEGAAIDTMV